jgi:DUF1680 family protein
MTQYPTENTSQFQFKLARPETFMVYVRIPEWIGPKTTLSVNGRSVEQELTPGKFFAVQRTWKDGDRMELELHMPLRLEAVDDQNLNVVALVRGPIALFAVGEIPARLTRDQLLKATPAPQSSEDWLVRADTGNLTLRPFTAIMSENYRLYQRVDG